MATTTETQRGYGTIAPLGWAGVVLAVILGIGYSYNSYTTYPEQLWVAFLLAGLGYFGAVVLTLVGYRRRLVYGIGIGYNILLFVLYFLLEDPTLSLSWLASLAGIAKIGQVVFVLLLGALLARRG